jgi:hypothetical protein
MNGRIDDRFIAVVLEAQLITTDDKLLRLVWPGFNAAAL